MNKILKITAIILLIILGILLVHTTRNYMIITDLQTKISKYSDSKNCHVKSISSIYDEGTKVIMEYYKKDDKQVVFMERNLNGEIVKISMYSKGEKTNTYTESKDSKVVQLDSKGIMSIGIYNFLETDNNWQTFLSSVIARLRTIEYKGKECYSVKRFLSSTSLTGEDSEIIIDKETGLYLKSTETGNIVEREYEFDNVDDSIFVEPDISQYKIKEK